MDIKDKKFFYSMIAMSEHCAEQFRDHAKKETGTARTIYNEMADRVMEIHDDLMRWKLWPEPAEKACR